MAHSYWQCASCRASSTRRALRSRSGSQRPGTSPRRRIAPRHWDSARVLGLLYQTPWTMLHRFRTAMVRPDRELLSGDVEVDESLIGAPSPSCSSRLEPRRSRTASSWSARNRS
jgi:hypothetical protein